MTVAQLLQRAELNMSDERINGSYSAVLPTLLKELASLKVFLLSLKVQSNALVVLLCRLGA